jgi:hypothetical protein
VLFFLFFFFLIPTISFENKIITGCGKNMPDYCGCRITKHHNVMSGFRSVYILYLFTLTANEVVVRKMMFLSRKRRFQITIEIKWKTNADKHTATHTHQLLVDKILPIFISLQVSRTCKYISFDTLPLECTQCYQLECWRVGFVWKYDKQRCWIFY